jgi:hypothetical protein
MVYFISNKGEKEERSKGVRQPPKAKKQSACCRFTGVETSANGLSPSTWKSAVFQKATFYRPKDGLLGGKRWPFAMRNTAFHFSSHFHLLLLSLLLSS